MLTTTQHAAALEAVASLEAARLALLEASGGTLKMDGLHNTSERQEVLYPSEQHEILAESVWRIRNEVRFIRDFLDRVIPVSPKE